MEVTSRLNVNDIYPLNVSVLGDRDSFPFEGLGPALKWRNVSIGSMGSVLNCLAFFIVFKSKRINTRHKLFLLNLAASDIIFLLVCASFGAYVFTGPGCIIMINLMLVTFLNTYLFVLLLSAVNFMAVNMPFWYRVLSMKHCGVATGLAWLLSAGLSLGGIGMEQHPSGQSCLIHKVITSYGKLMITTFTFILSVGVAVFNTAIVVSVRRGLVFPIDEPNNPQTSNRYNQSIGAAAAGTRASRHPSVSKTFRIPYTGSCNKVMPATITGQPSPQERPRAGTEATDLVYVGHSQTAPAEHHARPCETLPRVSLSVPAILITQVMQAPSEERVSPTSSSNRHTSRSNRQGRSPRAVVIPARQRHVDKMCKTLLILTTYSCLLTLPFCVYLVLLATRHGKLESIATEPIHVILTTCPIANALINAFFYGLNFINWRGVLNALRSRL